MLKGFPTGTWYDRGALMGFPVGFPPPGVQAAAEPAKAARARAEISKRILAMILFLEFVAKEKLNV